MIRPYLLKKILALSFGCLLFLLSSGCHAHFTPGIAVRGHFGTGFYHHNRVKSHWYGFYGHRNHWNHGLRGWRHHRSHRRHY